MNQAVCRSIWRARYPADLILLEGEVSECASRGLGGGILQQRAVVWAEMSDTARTWDEFVVLRQSYKILIVFKWLQ